MNTTVIEKSTAMSSFSEFQGLMLSLIKRSREVPDVPILWAIVSQ